MKTFEEFKRETQDGFGQIFLTPAQQTPGHQVPFENKAKIMWQANVTIQNNTPYNLKISGVGPGNSALAPNSSSSWVSSEVNNSKSLIFYKQDIPFAYIQGNLSFGPEAGVYVDRGWMADNDQTVQMVADANGKNFTQTQNGGIELLAWNEFENGGKIALTFSLI